MVEAIQEVGKEVKDDLNPVLKEEMYAGRLAQASKDFLTAPLPDQHRTSSVSGV